MNINKQDRKRKAPGGSPSTREQDQVRGLSVRQFAKMVGLGVTRCYCEMQLGHIHALKAGSRTIIPTTEIEAFFRRLEAAQAKNEGGR